MGVVRGVVNLKIIQAELGRGEAYMDVLWGVVAERAEMG